MTVAIDAGNSRIKWAVHDGQRWLDRGVQATADAPGLAAAATQWPANSRAVVCNVAGAAVGESISSLLAQRGARVSFLRAGAEACGVRSCYEIPEQLGADRWAALIGARAVCDSACVVVCAGTATTVDLLDANGVFAGGLILPGFELMRAALAHNTAQLPLSEGVFSEQPRNTMDAIVSGCLHAQLGAIERMFSGIAAVPGALCLLTGGTAPRLARHLKIPFQLMDNLILDGLLRFAAAPGS